MSDEPKHPWDLPVVGWRIHEPQDPPRPVFHTEPLDLDVTYTTEDGGVHERKYQRATPDSEWLESYRRDLTAEEWAALHPDEPESSEEL